MTHSWKVFALTLIVALAVAAVAAYWLGSDYRQERQTHEEVLAVRGDAVLAALEGGIRSHHRLGNWFSTNIDVVLEETSAAEGILGLGLFQDDGSLFAKGGAFPASVEPSAQPRWVDGGLLICRKTKFQGQAGGPNPARRRGWSREAREAAQDSEASKLDAVLQKPVWLAVLVDGAEYNHAMAKARRRFAVSLSVTLLAIGLGVVAVSLIQRQGRMRAELGLAGEREKRLEEMALLGAGLAHETKNPLGLIRGQAQSLLRHANGCEEEVRQDARHIIEEADRVVGRINAFLAYARPKTPERRDVDIGAIAAEVAELFRDEAGVKGVELDAVADNVPARADPDQTRQALVNLLANAVAACSKGDRVEVAARKDGPGGFALSVSDTGAGIDQKDIPNITKPYFTRRAGGTGLGLAIVKQIAEAHGWRLEIESRPHQGSLFTLRG